MLAQCRADDFLRLRPVSVVRGSDVVVVLDAIPAEQIVDLDGQAQLGRARAAVEVRMCNRLAK